MEDIRLTPTSYIVLGFLSLLGEATPYDLKRMVRNSVGCFWSFPHSQLYSEPERLARAGYVDERREERGRRRRRYSLTQRGRTALTRWAHEDSYAQTEIRDPALLRLFFGADPVTLATSQSKRAYGRLAELEALRAGASSMGAPGPGLALEYGIAVTRAEAEFWSALAGGGGSRPAGPEDD